MEGRDENYRSREEVIKLASDERIARSTLTEFYQYREKREYSRVLAYSSLIGIETALEARVTYILRRKISLALERVDAETSKRNE